MLIKSKSIDPPFGIYLKHYLNSVVNLSFFKLDLAFFQSAKLFFHLAFNFFLCFIGKAFSFFGFFSFIVILKKSENPLLYLFYGLWSMVYSHTLLNSIHYFVILRCSSILQDGEVIARLLDCLVISKLFFIYL